MLSYTEVMQRPRVIPCGNANGPHFDMVRDDGDISWMIADLASTARSHGLEPGEMDIVRIAGGYKDLDPVRRDSIFPYYAQGFGNPEDPTSFKALVGGGGTREKDMSAMVTQVPSYLGRLYQVMAYATTPKTSRLHLRNETGVLAMGKRDSGFDADGHAVAVLDPGISQKLGWDGDVQAYLQAMKLASESLGMNPLVTMTNGGDATVTEVLAAILFEIPVIVIEETLREADKFAAAIRAGTVMDYASNHCANNPCFIGDSLDELGSRDVKALVHIARLSDVATFREGVARFAR